jgi:hypothetical protein
LGTHCSFCLSLLCGKHVDLAGRGTVLCAGLIKLRGELSMRGLQLLAGLG